MLKAAEAYLGEAPVTVTASSSPRSAGGRHDYFSEADYWWPDPANPGGPYVQRDGQSNPDNFDDHRARDAPPERAGAGAGGGVPAHAATPATPSTPAATCAPGSWTRRRA